MSSKYLPPTANRPLLPTTCSWLRSFDESEEQTQRIIMAQRTKSSPRWYELTAAENEITKLHHNMQRMLKPYEVMIPDDLKISWPSKRLQYRGEHANQILRSYQGNHAAASVPAQDRAH